MENVLNTEIAVPLPSIMPQCLQYMLLQDYYGSVIGREYHSLTIAPYYDDDYTEGKVHKSDE